MVTENGTESIIVDKSPWDTFVMQRIVCAVEYEVLKKALNSFQKHVAVAPPHPIQC